MAENVPTPAEIQKVADLIKEGESKIYDLLKQQETASANEKAALEQKIGVQDKALDQLRAEFKGAVEKHEAQGKELDEARKRLDDVEKRLGRPGFGGNTSQGQKSLGEMFVEKLKESGSIDRMKSTGRRESDMLMIDRALDEILGQKATLALSDTTNFAPVQRDAMRLPDQRRFVLRQLMQVVPTMQNSIEYVEILGFGPETKSGDVTSITESGGVATVLFGAAHGLNIGDRFEVSGATGVTAYNTTHFVHTVVDSTHVTIKVTSGIGNPGGTMTWRTMRGGAAATVSEGSGKPEARMDVTTKTANIITIAHWLPATRQVLDDVSQIRGIIDNELLYGLDNALETKLFYGTGGASEIQGILTHANRQTYSGTSDTYSLDAIRKGITRVELAEANPTLVVVHPINWERMEITKSASDDHYVLAGGAMGSAKNIWRVPVMVTPRIAENTALVGDFTMSATLYDRQNANIRFSEHHSTYFTSNLVAILAEMRVGVAWKRPESFVDVSLPTAV